MDFFFFGGGGICIVTFSESGELVLRVVGLNMDGSLFSRFYTIWKTEVESSIQRSQMS